MLGITPILQVLTAIMKEEAHAQAESLDEKEKKDLHIWLVYANRTEEDILCREQLDAFAQDAPKNFKLHYTLSAPGSAPPITLPSASSSEESSSSSSSTSDEDEDEVPPTPTTGITTPSSSTGEWKFGRGRINEDMLRVYLPSPDVADDDEGRRMVLACGPDELMHDTLRPSLKKIGWDVDKSLVIF
jgi:nitrate reductase (NAD(P)H)